MLQLSRVLCAVDFSEISRHALDHAAAIANWYGAELVVLHVFPFVPVMDLPPMPPDPSHETRLTQDLTAFVAHLPKALAPRLRVLAAVDVHEEIVRQARVLSADVLVIGSHGRSGWRRLLLGSIAEKTIRTAPCPLAVVPPHAADRSPTGAVVFKRILCAIDFSPASACALRLGLSLAEEADAKLTLLHVIEVPPELLGLPVSAVGDIERLHAEAEAARLLRLREMVPEQARAYCTVETSVREGAAFREILRLAGEREADLIVMGTQGRGALDRLIFGSNAARVLRAATCPVLVVPAQD